MQPSEQVNGHMTQERSLLDQIAEETARVGARYMPTLTVKQFTEREKLLRELKEMLVEGVDYGVIPGTQKPTLLLPGAQKICTFFGYVPHYTETSIESWTADQYGEPLFYYKYICCLFKNNEAVGEGIGSASSWESKYRYRWVSAESAKQLGLENVPTRGGKSAEFKFSVEKAETGGKYGKPAEFWQRFKDGIANGTARSIMKADSKGVEREAWEIDTTLYRVPNSDFADTINTCQKVGQKRAYVAATLSATGASQYFTQDLEDMEHIDTGGFAKGTQEAADYVRDQKLAAGKSSGTQTGHPPTPAAAEGRGQSGAAPTSPEIEALVAQCTNVQTVDAVCGKLCTLIEEAVGRETADKVWADALKQFGDPAVKRAAWRPVVTFLYQQAQTAKAVAA